MFPQTRAAWIRLKAALAAREMLKAFWKSEIAKARYEERRLRWLELYRHATDQKDDPHA